MRLIRSLSSITLNCCSRNFTTKFSIFSQKFLKKFSVLAGTTNPNLSSDNPNLKDLVSNGFYQESLVLFQKFHSCGTQEIGSDLPSVLKACAYLQNHQFGLQIHSKITKTGHIFETVTANALLTVYSKCRCIEPARQVFDEMPQRDVVTWNSMISCYTRNGDCIEGLHIFSQMKEDEMNCVTWGALISGLAQNGYGVEALEMFQKLKRTSLIPNCDIIASILSVCGFTGCLEYGKQIHGHVFRNLRDLSVVLETALIDMYSKCGNVRYAEEVFDKMPERNLVSWTSMISGCLANQKAKKSLDLFREMQIKGLEPNRVTLIAVIPACAGLKALKQGKEIHGFVVRNGFDSDSHVTSSLVDMYSKSGGLGLAEFVFARAGNRDVVMWSSMIGGYSENGDSDRAMELFSQMQIENIKPNSVTILALISVCTTQLALQQGQSIHGYTIISGIYSGKFIGNSLIDMYAKSGCLNDSQQVFDEMPDRDSVSWSSLISGYGLHGSANEALQLFHRMQETGIEPDNIAFLAVLLACNHGGLVEEGMKIFESMIKDHKIAPRVEHFSCIIDLLGRYGKLEDAIEIVKFMPLKPSPSAWSSLVSACRFHGRFEFVEKLAYHMIDSEPENPANYTILAALNAESGNWVGAEELRRVMREKGLKKNPGLSWVGE